MPDSQCASIRCTVATPASHAKSNSVSHAEVSRHEPYNTKADVYSFAMILYEMATGLWPFQGMDPVRAATCAATDGLRPAFPDDLPAHFTEEEAALAPGVRELIEQCWSRQPLARCAYLRCAPAAPALWQSTRALHRPLRLTAGLCVVQG